MRVASPIALLFFMCISATDLFSEPTRCPELIATAEHPTPARANLTRSSLLRLQLLLAYPKSKQRAFIEYLSSLPTDRQKEESAHSVFLRRAFRSLISEMLAIDNLSPEESDLEGFAKKLSGKEASLSVADLKRSFTQFLTWARGGVNPYSSAWQVPNLNQWDDLIQFILTDWGGADLLNAFVTTLPAETRPDRNALSHLTHSLGFLGWCRGKNRVPTPSAVHSYIKKCRKQVTGKMTESIDHDIRNIEQMLLHFIAWADDNFMGRSQGDEAQRKPQSALAQEARALLRSKSSASDTISDYLAFAWFNDFAGRSIVSLSIGNLWTIPSEEEEKQVEELVVGLIKEGFRIIYDADSSLAKTIARVGGDSVVGVTGQSTIPKILNNYNIVTVKNPLIKLKILSRPISSAVIAGPGSVTGMALLLGKELNIRFDPKKVWTQKYRDWVYNVNLSLEGFTVSYAVSPSRVESLLGDVKTYAVPNPGKNTFKRFDREAAITDLSASNLSVAIEDAKTIDKARASLDGMASGAVLFGSGKKMPAYSPLVSNIAEYLGRRRVPLSTGGAGGLMEEANAAAFKAGGPSIGIPIIGGLTPSTEKKIAQEVHTLTLPVHTYEARIPLLLYNRDLILIAPGSAGTRKELATALVALATEKSLTRNLVFIGKSHYSLIVEGLKEAPLPLQLKSHIHLIDTPEELVPVYFSAEKVAGATP